MKQDPRPKDVAATWPCSLRMPLAITAWALVAGLYTMIHAVPGSPQVVAGYQPLAAAVAAGVAALAVGYVAKSMTAALAATAFFHYYALAAGYGDVPGLAGLIASGYIGFRSLKGGPSDAVVEYLTYPSRMRVSPLLAAAASALLFREVAGSAASYPYYPALVVASALVSAKQARPLIAAVLAALSGTGQYAAPGILLYAGIAPLPPIACGRDPIGRLVAYEASTSPGRALNARRAPWWTWRTRIVACSEPSTASINLGERFTIWLYSSEWRRLAQSLARALGRSVLVVDLDLEGPPTLSEVERTLARESFVGLRSLPPPERDAALSLIPGILGGRKGVIVAVGSCSGIDQGKLAFLDDVDALIVGSCSLPEGRLMTRPRSGRNLALIGEVPDTEALRNTLESLVPGWSDVLVDALARGLLVATPYCGPRIALIALEKATI